ncbi:MAG TPA: recombinase family protein [Candidatus Copromorpha excrementigallinarum]|uniref:Recombinase family protein n=1 Tax=Candidatus Allocopromorpha excrementigallinarum TaxID=2840742 RepID=A0A9D1I1M0_9FIRM|nr:recombinase family protein [Candidatus Copromorpha excrementigallinarum]
MSEKYGYARVSTKEQHEDRQMAALSDFGVGEKNIYLDKLSGKDFERPQYKRLVKRLKKEDILVVKSIDRLGRNYEEIINQWQFITKEKGVYIVVLDMPLLNTWEGNKDLTATFIADLVLQILSYVAETERENIRKRQAEGIVAARKRGVKFGRPPRKRPDNLEEFVESWKRGDMSSREAARRLDLAQTTFLRWAKEGGDSDSRKDSLKICAKR